MERQTAVDALNDAAYKFHYANLDSVSALAQRAFAASDRYPSGRAEALNNLAFVHILKMDYAEADTLLKQAIALTDNQLELLVANVQLMRLCQRTSRNEAFYLYHNKAAKCIKRLEQERQSLTPRQCRRLDYGKSEYSIVLSAYLYYVGQIEASVEALAEIDEDVVRADTAQLLNYYYNVGSGNFLSASSPEALACAELEYLARCNTLAEQAGLPYWQANAQQAFSEHLLDSIGRDLARRRVSPILLVDSDQLPDSVLPCYLAERAVATFESFGDVYQTAASLRTLSRCHFTRGEYLQAIDCLNEALERDTAINQAAALVVSIQEQLSINYSALDEKTNSDNARYFYLQNQNETRLDRTYNAIASQLEQSQRKQKTLLKSVCLAIIVVMVMLIVFTRMRKRSEKNISNEQLLQPLRQWQQTMAQRQEEDDEALEEIIEQQQVAAIQAERELQHNMEQRARMALINSVTPFIDRMLAEVRCLSERQESAAIRDERYAYIAELTDQIEQYNRVLTDWIQLRRGELNLKIESFPLQKLFDILKKGRQSFLLKGVDLHVEDTPLWVKADRTLTLFMVNTLADNARKFTPEGGNVRVAAEASSDYIEISVADTGCGMDAESLANVFSHQPNKKTQHGFGLMNCKGIIEKYRKTSSLFSVCQITAESQLGKGSTFRFRLPKGVVRTIVLAVAACSLSASATAADRRVRALMDSITICNIQERYDQVLSYADSMDLLLKRLPQEPDTIHHAMHKEAAVAALALHRWDAYERHNRAYIRLLCETSFDHGLRNYVAQKQKATNTRNIALVLLVLLLVSLFPAYYMLYYRHHIYYQYLINCVNGINDVLLSENPDDEKLLRIQSLWKKHREYAQTHERAQQLDTLVTQICEALQHNIDSRSHRATDYELASDELSRMNYEAERMHINNNVLDNCFSALKHETMYYPSHIRHLVEARDDSLETLRATADYYKDIYTILSQQAQAQIRQMVHIDQRLGSYLRQLLTRLDGATPPDLQVADLDSTYLAVRVPLKTLRLTDQQADQLFTPLTTNLHCLVIRQIVREIGETTNLRRSGIMAQNTPDGITTIEIILPKKIWRNLKL